MQSPEEGSNDSLNIKIHTSARFARQDIRQRDVIKMVVHQRSQVCKASTQTRPERGRVLTDGQKWAVHRPQDFTDRDRGGGSRKMISAADAPFAMEQISLFQDEQNLLQHLRRKTFGGRQLLDLGNGLRGPPRHSGQGAEGILRTFGKSQHEPVIPQPGQAESGKPSAILTRGATEPIQYQMVRNS